MAATIFDRYPMADEPVMTSVGPQPTPYHVYDGHIVQFGGTADLSAVKELLIGEEVIPVETKSGRALMGLWAAEEPKASHGPHAELQVSLYVSRQPVPPIDDSPFALLQTLLTDPDVLQMCHGLWNDTEAVAAYNREILGLSPQLASYSFERSEGRLRFSFQDATTGSSIAEGDIREAKRPPLSATVALFKSFGFANAIKAARTQVIEMKVVNPISDAMPYNAEAQVLSSSDKIVAQLFDSTQDRVDIADERYAALNFQPEFIEHMQGFQLVYRTPERATS